MKHDHEGTVRSARPDLTRQVPDLACDVSWMISPLPGASAEPTFAGPLHGVRSWRLACDPAGGPLLQAIAVRTIWPAGSEPMRASCGSHPRPHHEVPSPDCECGIYANHPGSRDGYERVEAYLANAANEEIAGVIEAWGKLEIHRDGFRAEWARPVLFFATRRTLALAERLAAAYGARARLVPKRSLLREELASLTSLSRETINDLIESQRCLLIWPARGDRWSCGFSVGEIDPDTEMQVRGRLERLACRS